MGAGGAPRLELGPGTAPVPAAPNGISPKPSPREESTDSSFRPPRFWKPRSLGVVSVVVAVAPDPGRRRLKNPAPVKGTAALDRSVMVPMLAPGPVEALWGTGGEMVRCWPTFLRRRRKKSKRTRIRVKPATPPTTLPTNVGVEGVLSPPDPAAAVVEAAGGGPAVPVGPPAAPGTPLPKLGLAALAEDEDDEIVEDEGDVEDGERVLVANVELDNVTIDDWMKEFEEVRRDPEGVGEVSDVEFAVGVTMTGIVVIWVVPEIISDDVIAEVEKFPAVGVNPALDICAD